MADIPYNAEVEVQVVRTPTRASARKTLERVLAKDPAAQREKQRLQRVREQNTHWKQRGGRRWFVRLPKNKPVKAEPGAKARLRTTPDIVRDLGSVERFVEVKPVAS